jgi:SAM-dependent methyltransferase
MSICTRVRSRIPVIEHVSNPIPLLRDCAAALTEDGIVVVVTPDVHSLAARLLGKRWWHFRVAHVGYFSASSLAAAARAAGLHPVRALRAKWFFRVHYLAERVSRYLPVGWINRRASRPGLLHRVYQRVIPVNLHDSSVIILAKNP